MEKNVSYERPPTKKSFEELKAEIKNEFANKEYSLAFFIKEFTKDEILRRSFLSVVTSNPARVHNIYIEGSFADKKQIYRKLYRLKTLGLIKQIPVSSVTMKKEDKTAQELEIEEDFHEWTSKMHPTMKQHFETKTNYWVLTDNGKNIDLINSALSIEKGSGKHE